MASVRRSLLATLAVAALALSVAGCVSMPDGGPVLSYTVTQGSAAQGPRNMQLVPQPPGAGWSPSEIVSGFLTASGSFTDRQKIAREYLTKGASRAWDPNGSATVFTGSGPDVSQPAFPAAGKKDQATVTVSGSVQASLSGSGTYAFPSAAANQKAPVTFHLVNQGGLWRISSAPNELLLTSVEFTADYQLRNLYFLDPANRYLVPDPVYVPQRTTPSSLMDQLVNDLISQPPDWLSQGTHSAFPPGTKLLGDVWLDGGTAGVNLGGAGMEKASTQVLQMVSAQLVSTLQEQPLVQSVELLVDGKPWIPPTAGQQGIPVQHSSSVPVPTGQSSEFYYLDSSGELWKRAGTAGAPVKVENIGTGYSAIAVSPHSHYLAALRDGMLFTGRLGAPLVKRPGDGYTGMSWTPDGDLLAAGSGGLTELPGDVTGQSGQGMSESVDILTTNDSAVVSEPITAVQVAPDGVRVALIFGGSELAFGAIAEPPDQGTAPAGRPAIGQPTIVLSPFSVSGQTFSGVAWYGPDNVITTGNPDAVQGPALTEYPVNGGTLTSISSQAGIESVTVSFGDELIAGAKGGALLADASTSGSWAQIGDGMAPAYPG